MINQSLNIDIASELSRFDIHLNNNPRTIFSAKFGVENYQFFALNITDICVIGIFLLILRVGKIMYKRTNE